MGTVERVVLLAATAVTALGVFVPIVQTLLTRGRKTDKPAETPVIQGIPVPVVNLTTEYVEDLRAQVRHWRSAAAMHERRADLFEATLRDHDIPVPVTPRR